MPYTHVAVSQTGFQGRPHDDHDHFKIHRLNETRPTDKSHYLMAAFGEVHVGEPIPAHYHGPAIVYVIEGEIYLHEKSEQGEGTKLVAGDVIHIDEESLNSWSSPNRAKVFGVVYAPSDVHPEDMFVKK